MPRLTIEEVAALLATPDLYTDWLTAKPAEAEVGQTRCPFGGPLARPHHVGWIHRLIS